MTDNYATDNSKIRKDRGEEMKSKTRISYENGVKIGIEEERKRILEIIDRRFDESWDIDKIDWILLKQEIEKTEGEK